jgi:hypothetical protein
MQLLALEQQQEGAVKGQEWGEVEGGSGCGCDVCDAVCCLPTETMLGGLMATVPDCLICWLVHSNIEPSPAAVLHNTQVVGVLRLAYEGAPTGPAPPTDLPGMPFSAGCIFRQGHWARGTASGQTRSPRPELSSIHAVAFVL